MTVDDVKREAYLQRADRARDRRHRHHPAALPGQPVGDARRHHVRAARRRADAGAGSSCRKERGSQAMNAPQPRWPAISDAGRSTSSPIAGSAAAAGAELPMIDPVRRRAVRGDRARRRAPTSTPRCAPRSAARRRRVGPARAGRARPPARGAVACDRRARRRARADRGARLRQADEAGARRRRRLRALLRVLRRRLRQAARRRRSPIRTGYTVLTWREPHGVTGHIIPWNYPMQIFGRTRRRRAGGGQRLRRQAGRGRVPVAAARRGARRRVGLPAGRAQHRHRARPRSGRGAGRAPGHRPHLVHRLAGDRHAGRRRRRRSATARSRWSWAASRRRSCSPTPTSTRRCR